MSSLSTPPSPASPGPRFLAVVLPFLPFDRLVRLGRLPSPPRDGVPPDARWTLPPRPSQRHPRGQGWRGETPALAPARVEAAVPAVTIRKEKGVFRLVAVDGVAAGLGLRPGQPLADARALHPGLVAVPATPTDDRALLEAIASWCRRWTPLVALDGQDALIVEITGVAHLFGGEEALLDEVRRALSAQGFACRAVIAGHGAVALALARHGGLDGRLFSAAAGVAQARLLPVEALEDGEAATALRRAGLRTLGDLALRPRSALAARFGSGLVARLDALLGQAAPPLAPLLEAPAYVAERRFATPLLDEAGIQHSLDRLARDLADQLDRHGEGARRIELLLFRTDGCVRSLVVAASRPLQDAAGILALFRERFAALGDALDPGFGFDVVRLQALAVERVGRLSPRFEEPRQGEALASLQDRLAMRLGPGAVNALVLAAEHAPERAARWVPVLEAPPRTPSLSATTPPGPCGRHAPLRLLDRPEPIEVMAEVPEGPPLRFRWRCRLHDIRRVEGPERIAPRWWETSPGLTRDLFHVETAEGHRFMLARHGLYHRETGQPAWMLHGLGG